MGKRSIKTESTVPRKKRNIESNNENVDTTNVGASTSNQTQVTFVKNPDPTLKCGKIKSIHLKNFMCHKNFKVELNMNVNVFVGLNGSGKSAILTAIAVGLGSRASSTARSTTLKDLVKRGETTASIEMVLTNEGIDAYEHEVFGDEIIVIRTINGNSGASLYKMKSKSGRVISTKKDALDKMIMFFNIQVENPVLILNQDAARGFLKDCDPKKLYTLFLKATQIETIIEKLLECVKVATTAKNRNENLVRSIQHLESEINIIKQKHQRLQSVAKIRRDIVGYKNEIEWLKVIQVEKQLEEIVEQLVRKRKEIEKISDIMKNKNKYEKNLKEKIRDLGTKYCQVEESKKEKEAESEQYRRKLEEEKTKLSSLQNTHTGLLQKKKTVEDSIKTLKSEIDEMEKNPKNIANMKRENMAKIEELEKKKQDLEMLIETAKRDLNQFQDTLSDQKEKTDRSRQQVDKIRNQVQGLSQQIRNFQNSSNDSLSVYGRSMSELIAKVEQLYKQKKFSEMPRGPLGRYIQVNDKKYRQAIENILGSFLQFFMVNNDKDRILLSNVLKQYPDLSRTTIITTKFQNRVYDVRAGKVKLNQGNGKVLVDAINVSDPVVMNGLIDQMKVETVVLVDNIDTANALTENIEDVPENLFKVWLLEPFTEFYPAPAYRSYAQQMKPSRYLQTDQKEILAGYEYQKQVLTHKMNEFTDEFNNGNERVRVIEKNVAEKRKLCGELQQKHKDYGQQLYNLRNIEYPPEDSHEVLKAELEELSKKQTFIMKKLTEAEEVVTKATKGMKTIQEKYEETKQEFNKLRNEMLVTQNEVELNQMKLNEMHNDLKMKTNQLVVLQRDEENYGKQENEVKTSIAEMISKIKGKRVEKRRNEDQINQMIRSAENQISRIESSNERIEDIESLLNSKTSQYDKMRKVRDAMEIILKTLEQSRNNRFTYVKRLRQHMTLRVKHKFGVLMNLRDFKAEIEIDNQDQTLSLKVIPRDTQHADAVSNTKSLSGGERSFSTVAFLISLWSCVEHPFYFLDEYDVFSDEMNRHMMTQLLFNEAKKKPDRQYGFLTPLDFSNIEASDQITLHKLQDPERLG